MRGKPNLKKSPYFFYRGDLHRKIRANRGTDLMFAWNYPQHKAVKHVYSDVRKNGERAYRTGQVSKMVNRAAPVIKRLITNGDIEAPQMSYGYAGRDEPYAYFWSEKDIMGLHDYLKTVNIGRPRADGQINTRDLPSAAELRAMVRQGIVLYTQTEDGRFVPTWAAERF